MGNIAFLKLLDLHDKLFVFLHKPNLEQKHEECNECFVRIDVAITNWRFEGFYIVPQVCINLQYTSTCYKTIKNAYPLFTVVYGASKNNKVNDFKCFWQSMKPPKIKWFGMKYTYLLYVWFSLEAMQLFVLGSNTCWTICKRKSRTLLFNSVFL